MEQNKSVNAIGVMSGTSLDGLDIVSCSFYQKSNRWVYQIHKGTTYKYPEELLTRLKALPKGAAYDLAQMHVEYGRFMAEKINHFLKCTGFKPEFISSHGYTVFHEPENGLTTQIGSGAEIAALTGIKTVCDLRAVDVALGGQGAPLVPIGDALLFQEYSACLNLGGFSNISFNNEKGRRIAFDICPVNFVLNHLSQLLGEPFDNKGEMGRVGKVDNHLLIKLGDIAFYKKQPPKSLGREFVEHEVIPIIHENERTVDVLRTFYEHASLEIAKVINENNLPSVLITGGGAYNSFLIERLTQHCKARLIVPEKELIDYKEALVFAFLGLLRLQGENNCLASVTGAKTDNMGGAVYG